MKRRFQVFISSTYTDLRDERQAAVEAVLKAGHIPAGMELFTAGSASQLQVIRQWIEESDLYVLILGGRYGSIEPNSGMSYTEVEFDYARSLGKPFFSVVITDAALDERVKKSGLAVIERDNEPQLRAFRGKVTSQLCAFFDTPKDVKLAVFECLPQFTANSVSGGWVSARDVAPSEDVARQLTALLEENTQLRAALEKTRGAATSAETAQPSFERLSDVFTDKKVTIPRAVYDPGKGKAEIELSMLQVALHFASHLARGVSNQQSTSDTDSFLFFRVASFLASFGLVEEAKVPASVYWQRFKLSKEGIRFLTWARAREEVGEHDTSQSSRADAPVESKKVDTVRGPSKKATKGTKRTPSS